MGARRNADAPETERTKKIRLSRAMRMAGGALSASSGSTRSSTTASFCTAPSPPAGPFEPSACPANGAPRPSSRSKGHRPQKLEEHAETDGHQGAESGGRSTFCEMAALARLDSSTDRVSSSDDDSRSPDAHHSLRLAHHSLRGAESDGQLLRAEPSVDTLLAGDAQGATHDGAVATSGDRLDGAAGVVRLDAHHSLRLAHHTLRLAESGGQPGDVQSVDGGPACEARRDERDDSIATGAPPTRGAVDAESVEAPLAHHTLRAVTLPDDSTAVFMDGTTDPAELTREQDLWVPFRDPEAEAAYHSRGYRTRPTIRQGAGAGCNTEGLRTACNTLWLCPCGCGSLVSRVEAIGAAGGRAYFTDDDGNAAREHTSSFHLGRSCDRLEARGRGLLARTHLRTHFASSPPWRHRPGRSLLPPGPPPPSLPPSPGAPASASPNQCVGVPTPGAETNSTSGPAVCLPTAQGVAVPGSCLGEDVRYAPLSRSREIKYMQLEP